MTNKLTKYSVEISNDEHSEMTSSDHVECFLYDIELVELRGVDACAAFILIL